MILGNKEMQWSIESYSQRLIYLFSTYMNNIEFDCNSYSDKANEKAKIFLRATIFKNKEFIHDYNKIKYDYGKKTQYLISQYTTCIMQLLGRLAECMIIDRCTNDIEKNIIFMNIALYKKDIYKEYDDVNYKEYVAFSPSFKYIFVKNNGVLRRYNVPDYNPQHTSKDIGWCKIQNSIEQLKVNIPRFQYLNNAKLQVKVSKNCYNVNIKSDYYLTPIIYFDLLNDGKNLKNTYPNSYIVLGREIDEEMCVEISNYFKILAGYITGIIDHINIKDFEIKENNLLGYLFRSNINNLLNYNNQRNILDNIEKEVEKYRKPIIIET